MFIISGTRTFAKNMGTSTEFCNCNNCGQTVRLQVMRGLSFLTFFWMPLIPFSSKYYSICPMCNAEYKIKKEQALELLSSSL